jgi:hypothetical protein
MIEKNQRASQRFRPIPCSGLFYVEGAGATRDMNMDGVFVLGAEPLPVGTRIAFSHYWGNEMAVFEGIVRRTVAEEGMGIQFTEMSRDAKGRLLSRMACST